MLDIRFIRKNLPLVVQAMAKKGADVDLATFEAGDVRRNTVSNQIAA